MPFRLCRSNRRRSGYRLAPFPEAQSLVRSFWNQRGTATQDRPSRNSSGISRPGYLVSSAIWTLATGPLRSTAGRIGATRLLLRAPFCNMMESCGRPLRPSLALGGARSCPRPAARLPRGARLARCGVAEMQICAPTELAGEVIGQKTAIGPQSVVLVAQLEIGVPFSPRSTYPYPLDGECLDSDG